MTAVLTHHQLQHFRTNGYLLLPTRLPPETVAAVKAAILEDVEAEVEPVVRDADGRVTRISTVLDRRPIFLETASSPLALDPLKALLGPNIQVLKNRHNHATLNVRSQADDFHRDNLQWSRGLLTIIFYLEDTTIENGCTQLVPGSHLLPGVDRHHRLSDVEWIRDSGLLDQYVHVTAEAGQMMAIDSTIFHRIGSNRTSATRMSMTIGYQSVDEFAEGDDPKRILVAGERIYGGNDRKR